MPLSASQSTTAVPQAQVYHTTRTEAAEFRPQHEVSVTRSELCSNEDDHDNCQHFTTKPSKRQRWVMLGNEVKSSVHTCAPSVRGGKEPPRKGTLDWCPSGMTLRRRTSDADGPEQVELSGCAVAACGRT